MQVKVKTLTTSEAYTSKSGKPGYRTPVQFADLGARYPVGRGTLYTATACEVGAELSAVLISYDHGEGRFSLR